MKKIYLLIGVNLVSLIIYAQTGCTFTGTGAGNSNTTGNYNTFTGYRSGYENTTASYNTFTGRRSGYNNITGQKNTFMGRNAGSAAESASQNTFIGYKSGTCNTSGSLNVFVGHSAGYNNLTGVNNTFVGSECGNKNTSGNENTFIGYSCGYNNTTGYSNTFCGTQSGEDNTTGYENTFFGYRSGRVNTGRANTFLGAESGLENTGNYNVFIGYQSGQGNTADYNTFIGYKSGLDNSSGTNNTLLGYKAGVANSSGSDNTFIGYLCAEDNASGSSNTFVGYLCGIENITGTKNTAFGYGAGPSGSYFTNTVAIGYDAKATGSNKIKVGNSSVTRIEGAVSWSVISDGRFKKDVKENVPGLEFITQLRPVGYTLDKERLTEFLREEEDTSGTKSTSQWLARDGFIAQEVAQLVKEQGYEFSGINEPKNENDYYSIRYTDFVMPLVKAVQEFKELLTNEQSINDQLKKELTRLKTLVSVPNNIARSSDAGGIELLQNQPNPFTTDTEIKMYIPENIVNAEIRIISIQGKVLKTLKVPGRGNTSVRLNGGDLNPGVYTYTLIADGNASFRKMTLTR